MHRLFIHFLVAVFTFAIGTIASLLLPSVLSPSPEMANRATLVLALEGVSPALEKPAETIPTRCGCKESLTESELANYEVSSSAPIEGGILNGRAISLPKPPYPPIAKAARASGAVAVRIVVNERGCIEEARALTGHPLLQAASVDAARRACFSPTRLSGKPVKVTGVITYQFVRG